MGDHTLCLFSLSTISDKEEQLGAFVQEQWELKKATKKKDLELSE